MEKRPGGRTSVCAVVPVGKAHEMAVEGPSVCSANVP